jgi:predicted dehydrogenase
MKLLIVGIGSIGRIHALNASKYAEVGVVDLDISKADELATECGCISFGNNLSEALRRDYAGVVVSAPHKNHIQVAIQAIQAGAHVLIEKPISHDYDEAKSFTKFAKSKEKLVFVVSNMRYHPAIQTLYNALLEIGKPLFARAHYGNYLPDMRPGVDYRKLYVADKKEGGVVLDGIHELDYLSWFFGPITKVLSDTSHISELEIEADDYAGILAQHKTGVRSEVHLDYLRRVKRRGCEIAGTDGVLDWISEGRAPEHCTVRLYKPSLGWQTILEDDNVDGKAPLESMMKDFIAAIEGKENILQSGEEALCVLSAALTARKGSSSGWQVS